MAACMRATCSEDAYWGIGLRMWARGYSKDHHPPVEATMGIGVCQLHGVLTTPADVLTDTGKAQIEAVFGATGRALPDWNTVEVVLLPLDALDALGPLNPPTSPPGSTSPK